MWKQVCKILSESSKGIRGARVEHNRFCVTMHFRCVKEEVTYSLCGCVPDCAPLPVLCNDCNFLYPSWPTQKDCLLSKIVLLLWLAVPGLVIPLWLDVSAQLLRLVCKSTLYYIQGCFCCFPWYHMSMYYLLLPFASSRWLVLIWFIKEFSGGIFSITCGSRALILWLDITVEPCRWTWWIWCSHYLLVNQSWGPLAEKVESVLKDYPTLCLTHGRKVQFHPE
jgi:hypothetical protein